MVIFENFENPGIQPTYDFETWYFEAIFFRKWSHEGHQLISMEPKWLFSIWN